LVKGLPC